MTFKVGDRVELKSGGPIMTVTERLGNGRVECVWFPIASAPTPSAYYFQADALREVKP